MGVELAQAAPWVFYALGILLLALSMLWDIYLSFIPHLLLAGAALALYGVSLPAAAAFLIPHALLLGLKLAWSAWGAGDPPDAPGGGGAPS